MNTQHRKHTKKTFTVNKKADGMRVMQWNANSVKNKAAQLDKFLFDNNVDIAMIQESFVKHDNEIKIKGFNKVITARTTPRNANINNIKGGCLITLIKDRKYKINDGG